MSKKKNRGQDYREDKFMVFRLLFPHNMARVFAKGVKSKTIVI
jgi:hypothetical protein